MIFSFFFFIKKLCKSKPHYSNMIHTIPRFPAYHFMIDFYLLFSRKFIFKLTKWIWLLGHCIYLVFLFQIPSYDTNSHCLCVVGEVYCWWQIYNPNYNPATTLPSFGLSSLRSTAAESNYTSSLEMNTDIVDDFQASGDSDSSIGQQGHVEINATLSITSPVPITCLVMGIQLMPSLIL